MTKERKSQLEQIDIAILGGGPAGLQAALVLSRTRKKIIVFDEPEPPRNAASHGVHGFLGLDGVSPIEIRKIAWKQIDKYDSAELRKEKIVSVNKEEDGIFFITSDNETSIKAKKVVLAVGYNDVYPDISVFSNVGEIGLFHVHFAMVMKIETVYGGIVVNSEMELDKLPKMAQNWTAKIKVFLAPI
jgi:thioredoxin reductase